MHFIKTILKLLIRLFLILIILTVAVTLPLRWVDPPTSAFMLLDRWRNDVAVDHIPVAFREISPHLALAVIAAEDQNFPHHRGFDPDQIRDAVATHRQGGRLRGASTISQQLARNLYLWPDRTWVRKGLELWFTAPLELFLPKQRILEIYLNVAEFSTGVYGAEAAAWYYFGKPAMLLSREESALLAAVLPSPKRLDAAAPDDWLEARQRWILGQMRNLGEGWVP